MSVALRELWKQGYRLHLLETSQNTISAVPGVVNVKGVLKYTGVWRKTGGDEVQIYGCDYDGFRAKNTELRKAGYRSALLNPL